MSVDTILHNAKITTNGVPSFVEAIAITGGKISAVGKDDEILRLREPGTQVIDAKRRTVIPGLNDSHMHPIRGGLNFNMELRWDGVPSLADALRMLKEQAARTPALSAPICRTTPNVKKAGTCLFWETWGYGNWVAIVSRSNA